MSDKIAFLSLILILLGHFAITNGIKCYQCHSLYDHRCDSYIPSMRHLKECSNRTASFNKIICRKIEQRLHVIDEKTPLVVRECGYIHDEKLDCKRPKFKSYVSQIVCECDKDACNSGSTISKWGFVMIFLITFGKYCRTINFR